MMKHLVRITSRNGVVYEERMTEGQLTQFLRLTETRTSLGVAFNEWEITITEAVEQEHEREGRAASASYQRSGIYALLS